MRTLQSRPTSLCSVLSAAKGDWSTKVVITEVKETDGHTCYLILINAVPKNSLDLDPVTFSQWTRYKELWKLWQLESKLHQQLYLRGEFPDFPKPKLFGKFDAETITERREKAEAFLHFIVSNDVLRKSQLTLQFFEQAVMNTAQESQGVSLEPARVSNPREAPLIDIEPESSATDIATTSGEDLAGNSNAEEERSHMDQESRQAAAFDPPTSPDPETLEEINLNTPAIPADGGLLPPPLFDFEDCRLPVDDHGTEREFFGGRRHSASHPSQDGNHPSAIERFFPRVPPALNSSEQSIQQVKSDSSFNTLLTASRNSPSGSPKVRVGRRGVSPNRPANENDYLLQAAHFIATAQKAESESAFELAFHCYKSAVTLLLQGVQHERDLTRRNAVRKKTAKYLHKAERLYRAYLAFDSTAFDLDTWLSSSVQDPTLIEFQGAAHTLRSYRFVKVLPSMEAKKRVLLVKEEMSDELFVIKLLEKSGGMTVSGLGENTVPTNVPYMARLVKFFDIDSNIVLLIEYAPHGRLWDFLIEYWEECQRLRLAAMEAEPFRNDITRVNSSTVLPAAVGAARENVQDQVPSTSTAQDSDVIFRSPSRNSYIGRHVRFSVGSDFDEPTELDATAFDSILRKTKRKKSSVASRDSFDSVDDSVIVGVDVAANVPLSANAAALAMTSPLSGGFASVLSTISTNVEHFSIIDETDAEEERPAAITTTARTSSTSNSQQPSPNDRTMSQSEALWVVTGRLKKQKIWDKCRALPETLVRLWTAQLVSALTALHAEGIVIRDLRPDNILLNSSGYIMLTYCSAWANVEIRDDLDALDLCYAAPEVAGIRPTLVTEAADWWSVGALLLELLCGEPMHDICLQGVSATGEIPFPDTMSISDQAKDLVSKLLVANPRERLTPDDIRAHPFFADIDWTAVDDCVVVTDDRGE
uniref:Ribosomal protein S6 kinase delta-1 n=1 Tax=Plectus sambesii TaxID=2011161 RepID=A0A914WTZ1_9BILA